MIAKKTKEGDRKMQTLTAAIVEDEREYSDSLSAHLKRWAAEHGVDVSFCVFSDGVEFITRYKPVQVVFMDIMMPSMNGIRIAEKLRKADSSVVLVFITNMPQYAIKAYEYDATDYILKPIAYDKFKIKMDRIYSAAQARSARNLTVPLTDGVYSCRADDVLYIEVSGHKIRYVMTDRRVIESHGVLSKIERELASFGFLRCNSCYLVNAKHIDWVRGLTVNVGGAELAVSRPRKKEFTAALTEYLSRGGE